MPFIALRKQTRERVDITMIENPRQVLKSGDCMCQFCETSMIVKAGEVMQAHFAHQAKCPTDYESQPESPEHRAAKQFLAEHLIEEFPEYGGVTIEYEVPIPEVKRVADLLVTWPGGHRKVIEIQLSSITTGVLKKRTEDYEQAGIDVIWWLGGSAFTSTNVNWCFETFGFCYHINNLQDAR